VKTLLWKGSSKEEMRFTLALGRRKRLISHRQLLVPPGKPSSKKAKQRQLALDIILNLSQQNLPNLLAPQTGLLIRGLIVDNSVTRGNISRLQLCVFGFPVTNFTTRTFATLLLKSIFTIHVDI